MTPRFVLADLDGTLVDSTPAVTRSWRAWGARHGLDGDAIVAASHGCPAAETVARVLPDADVEAEAAALEELEVRDTDGVVALPGATEVLGLPHDRVAIVTSCTERLARARLAAAGLPVPRVLVCSDMVARGKPAPDPYLLGARRLGADPADCLVLEDAPAGVAAGRAAGMTVLAVTTSHAAAELRDAELVASGLPELLARLMTAART